MTIKLKGFKLLERQPNINILPLQLLMYVLYVHK